MAKIILEFDSNEDWNEAQIAINANKLQSVIWNLDQQLRKFYKYESKETIGTEECRELLRSMLENEGLNFEHEIFN